MCWSILYSENKIAMDYTLYKKVNVLENFDYVFQIDKIIIKNKLYYSITHNQCACDFFNIKKLKLREEFVKLILQRLKIICIEPCIFVKWIDDNNGIEYLPNNIVNIYENNLVDIFSKKYNEVCYCVKREDSKIE